jgi:hypothetical protein
MTPDEIIEMARRAGYLDLSLTDRGMELKELEAFAKLVAAKERSDCVFTVSVALLGSEKQLADRVINALLTRGEA